MKKLYILCLFVSCVCVSGQLQGNEKIKNLLEKAPYRDGKMGKAKLVDNKHLFMMQVALKPGQEVPQHNSNSNVHIIILEGKVVINLAGKDIIAKKGDLISVALKAAMNIKNKSQKNATFLIIKTPHPSSLK